MMFSEWNTVYHFLYIQTANVKTKFFTEVDKRQILNILFNV